MSSPRKSHKPMPVWGAEDVREFWSHVRNGKETDCWPFVYDGSDDQDYWLYRYWKGHATHRTAAFLSTGIDPGSNCVLHTCDRKACCNPSHLWIGNDKDNQTDARMKGITSRVGDYAKARRISDESGGRLRAMSIYRDMIRDQPETPANKYARDTLVLGLRRTPYDRECAVEISQTNASRPDLTRGPTISCVLMGDRRMGGTDKKPRIKKNGASAVPPAAPDDAGAVKVGVKKRGPGGRPSTYTQAIGRDVCARLADGMSLQKICERMGLDRGTVLNWKRLHEEFSRAYADAREMQGECVGMNAVHAASSIRDVAERAGQGKMDPAVARVVIDALDKAAKHDEWAASRMATALWGDKVDMTHAVTTTEAVRVIVTSGPDPYHDAPGRVAKSTKGTNETRKQ